MLEERIWHTRAQQRASLSLHHRTTLLILHVLLLSILSTGSETLAAKLPRSQTEFITSTSPTSATSQDRFKYPTRSHTTGHQNLARSPSNLHSAAGSLKPTTTSTPASFGATHSSHESISTIDPLSQVC